MHMYVASRKQRRQMNGFAVGRNGEADMENGSVHRAGSGGPGVSWELCTGTYPGAWGRMAAGKLPRSLFEPALPLWDDRGRGGSGRRGTCVLRRVLSLCSRSHTIL